MNKCQPLTIPALLVFTLCTGCYHAYLQEFRSTYIGHSDRVHIEHGKKNGSIECGGSFATRFRTDTTAIADGNYYDFGTRTTNELHVNQLLISPPRQLSLFLSWLGPDLVSIQTEASVSGTGKTVLYRWNAGIGVRLYKGTVAGRIFTNGGIMNARTHVFVFEDSDSGYYDLRDDYTAHIPFIEQTFAINANNPRLGVSPFFNLSFLHANLFDFNEATVNLFSVQGTFGLFRDFGPVTLSGAIQAQYQYGRKTFPGLRATMQLQREFSGIQ